MNNNKQKHLYKSVEMTIIMWRIPLLKKFRSLQRWTRTKNIAHDNNCIFHKRYALFEMIVSNANLSIIIIVVSSIFIVFFFTESFNAAIMYDLYVERGEMKLLCDHHMQNPPKKTTIRKSLFLLLVKNATAWNR